MNCCVAFGFETMSRVNTWKGNEFIALASDTNFDFPVGGFYTGYYAMMVRRHMHEFGTTVEQMAMVSVKNQDRKSTRLNSSHGYISYAVFCLKKKKKRNKTLKNDEEIN